MIETYPNQRIIRVHREKVKSDFLGIKNGNWQFASRDLGAHALRLYLYFASNADNYSFALSPADIRQTIGIPNSTYRDQFLKLIDKGYLVQSGSNCYDFYETPKRAAQLSKMIIVRRSELILKTIRLTVFLKRQSCNLIRQRV